MFRTALIAHDGSAAQGRLRDCLSDLRDIGATHVILTHVRHVGQTVRNPRPVLMVPLKSADPRAA